MMIIDMRDEILCIYLGLLLYTDSNQPIKMDIKWLLLSNAPVADDEEPKDRPVFLSIILSLAQPIELILIRISIHPG